MIDDKNITTFFMENKILLIVLTLIFLIGGVFSYKNIKRNEDPGFKIRTATVTTKCPNMNASEVDRYVSRQIEDVILEMDEIEHIKTQSYNGLSMIFAEVYETYTEMQPIWDKLRRKVDKIRPILPSGLSPFVNDEFADVYGSVFSISGDDFSYKELKDMADDIKDELLTLKNVGKVEIMGAQEETVYLGFKPTSSFQNNIDHFVLKNYLEKTNILGLGGFVKINGENILIEGDSNFLNLEDIKNTTIPVFNHPMKLSDIYDIKKGYADPPVSITRSNGKNALLFVLSMKEGGNILKWSDEIKAEIERLKANYPIGVNFEILAMQGDYVKTLTDKFSQSLIESVLIVILIVLLILGLKAGFIIGGIILCIILSAVFVMEKTGLGLDKISLSALIISLGILVDNSIVIAEGCIEKIKNLPPEKARGVIIETTKKYQIPLLSVSLITSFAFLPVYLAKSAVSEYSNALFKVMFITLMFSWFYSTTLLPYLISTILTRKPKPQAKNKGKRKTGNINIVKYFSPLIKFSLNNPKKTLFFGALAVLISFILFSFTPKIFFPDSDRPMFEIRVNLPENANIFKTKDTVIKIEDFLKKLSLKDRKIKNFSSYIGTSAPRYVLSASPVSDRENFGMILVNVDNFRNVDGLILKVKKYIDSTFPDVNSVVRKVPLGPPYDAPVEIRVSGQNGEDGINKIFTYVYLIEEKLKEIKGVYLVKNDWGYKTPRIKIEIDSNKTSLHNLSSYEVLSLIKSAYEGLTVSYYFEGTTRIPIVYKMGKDFKGENFLGKTDNINTLQILSGKGKIIPLSEVSTEKLAFEYPKIFRRDNRPTVTVQAWIDENQTADNVIKKMLPYLNNMDFEYGYGYEIGGSFENSKKGNKSITDEIPTAFGAIILILIFLFNSIKKPLIVSISALAALLGANAGLFITGSYFGFMTFLGYICLTGIAMNNSVILIETIPDGASKLQIRHSARSRIKPVLLTALTTIGGMLPLWITRDPMFESMAVAIIFGLFSSVLITLVITPALYILFYPFKKSFKK